MTMFSECMFDSFLGMCGGVILIISTNVLYNFCARACFRNSVLFHLISIILGSFLLYYYALGTNIAFFVLFVVFTYLVLSLYFYIGTPMRKNLGYFMLMTITIYIISSEHNFPDPEVWLQLKGIFMVATIKVIMLAFDLSHSKMPVPSILAYAGYLSSPATVLFGPPLSYKEYIFIKEIQYDLDGMWVFKTMFLGFMSLFNMAVSTCIEIPFYMNKFAAMYASALSFRTSHYFISYLSEANMVAAGFTKDAPDSWTFSVTRPFRIEFPRSLTVVVHSWNIPMHYFLREYIYKRYSRKQKFIGMILTYFVSSMLHGFNVEITVVLMTLALFSYVQMSLRKKAAEFFSACIKVVPCENCRHKYGAWNKKIMLINFIFLLLTMIDLVYVGILMDSVGQDFNLVDSLSLICSKWSSLYYISHIINGLLFLISLLF